ncbi:MAG: OmpA family protein [bacterium]
MNNKKRYAFSVAVLTSALLVTIAAGCGHNKQVAAESQKAQAQVADLQKKVSQLEAEKNKAKQETDNLQKELAQLADKEKLNLQKLDQYSVLSLPNTLVFSSGSIKLSAEGTAVLGKIAEVLKRYPAYEIRIEGHTDNKQIRPEFQNKYATNWELSSARATAVVRHLTNQHKMNPQRLGAVGYGEHRPAATNDNEDGRAKNRRVEFHIYPAMQSRVLNK